jgi:acetyl esterase/lipase
MRTSCWPRRPKLPGVKKLAAVAALATAMSLLRRRMAMRSAMAAVSPDLRHQLLPFFPLSYSPLTLPFWRLASAQPVGPAVVVSKRQIGDNGAYIFITTPENAVNPRAAVLWMHGGGMIFGNPGTELPLAGTMTRELGVTVVLPSYRLAPENPFPAALDDCMAALSWMRSNAGELGIDPDRIAVGGSSAGGGLAAAIAQRSYDEGQPVRAQALVSPMLDDRTVLRADHGGRGRLMWTPKSNRFAWASYLGREPDVARPPEYAAPARREELRGLPPAWIGVGDLDLFYDEDVAYAESLRACGVACELATVPGMYHGANGVMPNAPSMLRFRASMLDHLRAHLMAVE